MGCQHCLLRRTVTQRASAGTCPCRLYVAPANAPMGHLDALPNAPKLWQALAHPLVRPAVAKILQFLPERSSAAEALKIGPLSLSVLDSHLEHALGKGLNQGASAVRCHVNLVRAKASPLLILLLGAHTARGTILGQKACMEGVDYIAHLTAGTS